MLWAAVTPDCSPRWGWGGLKGTISWEYVNQSAPAFLELRGQEGERQTPIKNDFDSCEEQVGPGQPRRAVWCSEHLALDW